MDEDDVAEGEFSLKAVSPPLIPTPLVMEIVPESVQKGTALVEATTKVADTMLSLPTPSIVAVKEGPSREGAIGSRRP